MLYVITHILEVMPRKSTDVGERRRLCEVLIPRPAGIQAKGASHSTTLSQYSGG